MWTSLHHCFKQKLIFSIDITSFWHFRFVHFIESTSTFLHLTYSNHSDVIFECWLLIFRMLHKMCNLSTLSGFAAFHGNRHIITHHKTLEVKKENFIFSVDLTHDLRTKEINYCQTYNWFFTLMAMCYRHNMQWINQNATANVWIKAILKRHLLLRLGIYNNFLTKDYINRVRTCPRNSPGLAGFPPIMRGSSLNLLAKKLNDSPCTKDTETIVKSSMKNRTVLKSLVYFLCMMDEAPLNFDLPQIADKHNTNKFIFFQAISIFHQQFRRMALTAAAFLCLFEKFQFRNEIFYSPKMFCTLPLCACSR